MEGEPEGEVPEVAGCNGCGCSASTGKLRQLSRMKQKAEDDHVALRGKVYLYILRRRLLAVSLDPTGRIL